MTHSWLPASLNNTRKWGWREIDILKKRGKKGKQQQTNKQSHLYLLIPYMDSRPLTHLSQEFCGVKKKKNSQGGGVILSGCLEGGEGGRRKSSMKDAVDSAKGMIGEEHVDRWLITDRLDNRSQCAVLGFGVISVHAERLTNVSHFTYL